MGRRRAAAPESPEPLDQLPSCGLNMVCEPTGMRVERVLLFEGPREVEVIEECHCELRLSQCIRVPALRTYYAETPYETVIDVGGCSQSKGGPGACECVCVRLEKRSTLTSKTMTTEAPIFNVKCWTWILALNYEQKHNE